MGAPPRVAPELGRSGRRPRPRADACPLHQRQGRGHDNPAARPATILTGVFIVVIVAAVILMLASQKGRRRTRHRSWWSSLARSNGGKWWLARGPLPLEDRQDRPLRPGELAPGAERRLRWRRHARRLSNNWARGSIAGGAPAVPVYLGGGRETSLWSCRSMSRSTPTTAASPTTIRSFAGDELYVSMNPRLEPTMGACSWHARDALDLEANRPDHVDRMVAGLHEQRSLRRCRRRGPAPAPVSEQTTVRPQRPRPGGPAPTVRQTARHLSPLHRRDVGALLVLRDGAPSWCCSSPTARRAGGMGWSHATASRPLRALYGFLSPTRSPVVGGYIADRFWGTHRSMTVGGSSSIAARALLHGGADHADVLFWDWPWWRSGPASFKVNASTMVGQLYRAGDPRRDGPASRFSTWASTSAPSLGQISPCGYLGESPRWGVALRFRRRRRRDVCAGLAFYLKLKPRYLAGIGDPTAARPLAAVRAAPEPLTARGARPDGGAAGDHGLQPFPFWLAYRAGPPPR